MEPEIISAIIAVIGVFVSVAISLIIGFWSKRHNENQLFAETVSSNRIEWINSCRTNVAKFLASAEILHEIFGKGKKEINCNEQTSDCEIIINLKRDMIEAQTLVNTRLNMQKDLQRLVFVALKNLDYTKDNFYQNKEVVEEVLRQTLRPEWERVKREAKGKEKNTGD